MSKLSVYNGRWACVVAANLCAECLRIPEDAKLSQNNRHSIVCKHCELVDITEEAKPLALHATIRHRRRERERFFCNHSAISRPNNASALEYYPECTPDITNKNLSALVEEHLLPSANTYPCHPYCADIRMGGMYHTCTCHDPESPGIALLAGPQDPLQTPVPAGSNCWLPPNTCSAGLPPPVQQEPLQFGARQWNCKRYAKSPHAGTSRKSLALSPRSGSENPSR